MIKNALVWFKTDLRIEDNETLLKAIAQSEKVIPVYCFDESHFETTVYGFKKTGSFRAQFLLESLEDLDAKLRALGSGLRIVMGKPEVEIPKLVQEYKAQKVFAKREVAFEEKQIEKKYKVNYSNCDANWKRSALVLCTMPKTCLFQLKTFLMCLPISEKKQKKILKSDRLLKRQRKSIRLKFLLWNYLH